MEPSRPPDLARAVLQLLAIGALIVSTFWIVRPFLVASSWAATIAIATWPLLLQTQGWLGGRRSIAVVVMTTAMLLILLVPFYLLITAIVQNAGLIAEWSRALGSLSLPPPPDWVASVPGIGPRLAPSWRELAAETPDELAARLEPYARMLALWFVGQVGNLGLLLLQFLLTIIVVAILYANGETAARGVERFARRLAGQAGESAVRLAAQAVRAVALGVVVTALVQSALVGVGLAVAGIPFVSILVGLTFIFAVAQLGALPVLVPATIWVYRTHGAGWGTAFLVWALVCAMLDNFLRPVLIRRGADLPLLLIFAGVIGGLIGFGIIGLFIGPVVLAVGYTLLGEWVSQGDSSDGSPQAA
jgi:predicted PurR-regulated permease PerM